jgi:hypothetical protein
LKLQGLARPFVELSRYFVQGSLRVYRQQRSTAAVLSEGHSTTATRWNSRCVNGISQTRPGLTPVHVSKVVGEFQRADMFETRGRTLTIFDEAELRRAAEWR